MDHRMFSFRKKPTPAPIVEPAAPFASTSSAKKKSADHRRHYRVRRTTGQPLGVGLRGADGKIYAGDCQDISVGGAGITFPLARDPALSIGDEIEVGFKALARNNGIRANARVMSRSIENDRVRYGVQFKSAAELFAQMDSFYARYFNRRAFLRVLPELNSRVVASLTWNGGSLETKVHDLSVGGLGLHVTHEQATELERVDRVDVTLTVPGIAPITLKAHARTRTPFQKHVLVGLSFEEGGGIEQHKQTLQRYVDARVEHINRYNSSVAAPERKAR